MIINTIKKAYFNNLFYPKYPLGITIYLNNFCNLKCSFCEIGQINKSKNNFERGIEISIENINKIIDLSLRCKIKNFYITGGEPFVSKNLWYLLSKCKENRIIIDAIDTNGTLLNNLGIKKIQLINDVVKELVISIDNSNSIEHDLIRGVKGTFNKIEKFFLNKDKRKLFNTNFSLCVVVHNKNYKNLNKIIDLGTKWNANHINFQPVSTETIFPDMTKSEEKDNFIKNFSLESFIEILNQCFNYAKEKKISTNLSVFKIWSPYYFKFIRSKKFFFEKSLNKFTCAKVFNFIHINYNGDLIPCTNLNPIANLRDKDFFKKWQKFGKKIKKMFKKKIYFKQCKSCFCDFPASFRISLLYYPLHNFYTLFDLWKYYYLRKIKRYNYQLKNIIRS